MKLLVTGANGFVGTALVRRLLREEVAPEIVAAARDLAGCFSAGVERIAIDGIHEANDWSRALAGCDVVVHLAARVHVMEETSADPLKEFRRVNVQGTLNLARQAAAAGVRRFVFISSIKVNGESTPLGSPFKEEDAPAPRDAYGVSKMEAELGLREVARETSMDVVIIRPPLVYGLGVKANFNVMMRWLKSGVPLPLGAIHNRRSLVALGNLVDLMVVCLTHPAAANQTFLVSDGEDVSTTELLHCMGRAMGCPVRLIPVPVSWLKVAAILVGKRGVFERLCESLQVDTEKARRLLGWNPPLTLNQGLQMAAEGI